MAIDSDEQNDACADFQNQGEYLPEFDCVCPNVSDCKEIGQLSIFVASLHLRCFSQPDRLTIRRSLPLNISHDLQQAIMSFAAELNDSLLRNL
jgi:hypothetical protein